MSLFSIGNTIIKSLFKCPATTLFPLAPKTDCKLVRGQVANNIPECIFCGICQKKCPTGAIKVSREGKSWEIERSRCVLCTNCVEFCPKKCLSMNSKLTPASENMIVDTLLGEKNA